MKTKKNSNFSVKSIVSLLAISSLLSCSIEPPLHLPQRAVTVKVPVVITEIEIVWEINVDWYREWWYGWDDYDIELWGELEYPDPTNFEVRRFFQGLTQSETHVMDDAFTVYGSSFRRRYNFGFYDLLLWSNIDSKDGTQTVVVDEVNPDQITATTTRTQLGYQRPSSRAVPLKNQPDIFYSGYEPDFYISEDPLDYDYYDKEEDSWVKMIHTVLDPVVYIYLVQVVIYNNNGKITGLNDNSTMTNMAEGVNLNTRHTSMSNVDVAFAMRMKNNLPAREGRMADIMGGKFTTFGLCDMDSWQASRGPQYAGSRGDLKNSVLLNLRFKNSADAVYTYDVTSQVQRQSHGGIITIEIDADTIKVPEVETPTGSGFKPWVEEYGDSIVHEFGI